MFLYFFNYFLFYFPISVMLIPVMCHIMFFLLTRNYSRNNSDFSIDYNRKSRHYFFICKNISTLCFLAISTPSYNFSTFSCIIFILLMIYNYSNYFPMYLPIYSYNSILVSAFFSSASIYSGKGSPIWHSPHMSTPIIFLSFKKNFNRCSSIPRLMCP